ncbi:MAG TPA: RNA polymerase subunit sigma-70 [Kofleriaceae bacterium]|jgi:RNA polymerase sigma-70 factor (ECF subfamily)
MATDLEAHIGAHRRELLAHCYRMTGALSDAEDALQETFVRAWRGYGAFEGRSSVRAWLYRIATNACLDHLTDRRARVLPDQLRAAGTVDEPVAPDLDAPWLEPFPDAMIEDDPEMRPDAMYSRREATRLAFVVALQRLSPRQRAMLILRDVVALSAEEAAVALDVTVATANSLLQRARETIEAPAHKKPAADPARLRDLLARYVRAWEGGDTGELIALLRTDAFTTMPPSTLWLTGRETIAAFMAKYVLPRGQFRLVPFAINDAPGFIVYCDGQFVSLTQVETDGEFVASFHSFMGIDPARFGISPTL